MNKLRKPLLGRLHVAQAAAVRRVHTRIERMATILHAENRLRAALARARVRRICQ